MHTRSGRFFPPVLSGSLRLPVYMCICVASTSGVTSRHCTPAEGPRLVADGLWLLVLVVAILGLELLNERDVLLLGLVRGDTLVNLLLPRVLLCLALCAGRKLLAGCLMTFGGDRN